MITVSVFTVKDAEKEFTVDNGLELAIKKWQSICEGLEGIARVVHARCGLCIQYDSCAVCPLSIAERWVCGDEKSSFTIATRSIDNALVDAYNMLDVLKAIRNKEALNK